MSAPIKRDWDFFVSYASEDREEAALPLANELRARGFEVWLDQFVLRPEDKIDDTIINGLTNCYYGIVIVSSQFLRKDWPRRELDILLSFEKLDGRMRLVIVLHNLQRDQVRRVAPRLGDWATITTSVGFNRVCDQILDSVLESAKAESPGIARSNETSPFPPFRAPGVVSCPNSDCSWEMTAEMRSFFGLDVGPEFVVSKRGANWFAVCTSCGEVALGPIDLNDAKQIVGMARMIAAPTSPYD